MVCNSVSGRIDGWPVYDTGEYMFLEQLLEARPNSTHVSLQIA